MQSQGAASPQAEPVTPGMLYEGYSTYTLQPYSVDNPVDIQGCIYRTATSSFAYVAARLQLPQGARVQEITLYFKDNTPSTADGVVLHITRDSYMQDSSSNTLSASSVGLAASTAVRRVVRTLSTPLVIDNAQNAYTLIANLTATGSSLQICGARIGYTFASAAPIVVKQ
jgi:hypothetical protein